MGENASVEDFSVYGVLENPLRVGFSSRKSVFEPYVVVGFLEMSN